MIVKLDLEKTYDRLKLQFVNETMELLLILNQPRDIRNCISSTFLSVN